MRTMWETRRLEFITLFIFILLVSTSLFILYSSYENYALLESVNMEKAFVHKVIMFISSFILFLSLLIVFFKRDYFFLERSDNGEALENLLNEIKHSSDASKMNQFKQMLKDKNHTEIYPLISNMINELQESKRLADEANESKSLFLSNISHEIGTPINGIVGFTKILGSSNLDKEQREFVTIIRKSSEDLLGVVNNILDVSKIKSGMVTVEKSYFNIMDSFENLSDIYALEASKKNLDLFFWIDPYFTSTLVESDMEKIKQVLMNLISNAIKFTPDGGSVDIRIERDSSVKNLLVVKFVVTDTGIGIPEEQQSQVFNPFSQVDSSSTREQGGAGLGLSIANSWVSLLGGKLKLESVELRGTTFSFSLEMKEQKSILHTENIKALNVALYAPIEVREKKSNDNLIEYLTKVKGLSLTHFKTFVECRDTTLKDFFMLYIHYDEINKEELQHLISQYNAQTQIVLVAKLKNRAKILDIAPLFSQIIYEPVTYSKVQNSLTVQPKKVEPLASKAEAVSHFKLKALVIEDNKVNQKLIVHTLAGIGILSDTADNGEIGVEMFKQNSYDLVFMDIQMPVMNGVIATKEILKYEKMNRLVHTPIIAVTTNTLKGDRERYLDAGMDEYISKPISSHKFITVVKKFYSTVEVATPSKERKDIVKGNDLLLYKENPTEAKIMTTMLKDLGYTIDVAKNQRECNDMLGRKGYKALLLDRSETNEDILMEKIDKKGVETLLFIDAHSEISTSDLNSYIHLMNKSSDFSDVRERLERIIGE